MCSVGAILMLMKADTVSTPLVRQRKTLARPRLFVAGFSGAPIIQLNKDALIKQQGEMSCTDLLNICDLLLSLHNTNVSVVASFR